jgi:hypothetical protein
VSGAIDTGSERPSGKRLPRRPLRGALSGGILRFVTLALPNKFDLWLESETLPGAETAAVIAGRPPRRVGRQSSG